ncbi:hypothetical protein HPULCUR_006455 [Helicostylum pulchrum]|uniref:Uncharacterized protein n=1 Tax=Helicostylum pulchrum TaxID=562976 RepID=A0ABP9Y201_9FUNG
MSKNRIFDNNDKNDNSQTSLIPLSLKPGLGLKGFTLAVEKLEALTIEALELNGLKTKLKAIEEIVYRTKQQRME